MEAMVGRLVISLSTVIKRVTAATFQRTYVDPSPLQRLNAPDTL